ncbi:MULTISPECIES: SDR family NAD(P)-dependent oxidoreductase [Actinosynnema]|uniref:Short-chain dehydrogenase n=1 Tax=Actinosynnema pretiosum TaxID=42197 RepID=A0A290ZCM3_9PSEU|nr:SDR family NAD(P)-dependent oxidoreductase [Actinosynnema pretiosum]ATE56723.1 short-chain dehydrogenase [Actinosynnema pretiosum]
MRKVIVVFGAGTGLGAAVARRFGREGYRVALVARRRDRLDALVAKLAEQGIEAEAFTADLSDHRAAPALVETIRERMGRIDVVEYAPIGVDFAMTPAAELTTDQVLSQVALFTLTPVALVGAVLPELLERGDGAVLIGQGMSAAHPVPGLSGVSLGMAATRNYVHSLHGELAGRGVYAGTLTIGAMIAGSAAHELVVSGELGGLPKDVPTADPDVLAELYWEMLTTRTEAEREYPAR